jgi:hypothetical protein
VTHGWPRCAAGFPEPGSLERRGVSLPRYQQCAAHDAALLGEEGDEISMTTDGDYWMTADTPLRTLRSFSTAKSRWTCARGRTAPGPRARRLLGGRGPRGGAP